MAKRNFGEGPIYTITNYIFWFFLSNLFFWLVNPLQFVLIFAGNSTQYTTEYIVLLYLLSLPMGPALAALLSLMGKLVREKDLTVTKDFFKAYKLNFKQALFLWILESTSFALIYVDIAFFKKGAFSFLVYLFLAAGFIIFILGLYAFPIMTRFYFNIKDLLKLSFIYSIKKIKVTLACISTFVLAFVLLRTQYASLVIIFMASFMCYLNMFYMKEVFDDIQANYTVENPFGEEPTEDSGEDTIFKDTKGPGTKK